MFSRAAPLKTLIDPALRTYVTAAPTLRGLPLNATTFILATSVTSEVQTSPRRADSSEALLQILFGVQTSVPRDLDRLLYGVTHR